jgi:hypothetical protein
MASTVASRFFLLLIAVGLTIRDRGNEAGWITWDDFVITDGSAPSIVVAKDGSSNAETLQGVIFSYFSDECCVQSLSVDSTLYLFFLS